MHALPPSLESKPPLETQFDLNKELSNMGLV
jgi:hypothetical protein